MPDFVDEAAGELGYTEDPPGSNRTKFAAEASHTNGQPWCATFIVAIARRCGIRLPSESAYTPTMWNAFKAAGMTTTEPRRGDIAFFDFPDSKDRVQHVGIVESATATKVTCIEGNTSSSTTGSQDNGGGVYRRTRSRTYVVGFGRPTIPEEDDVAVLVKQKGKPEVWHVADARTLVHVVDGAVAEVVTGDPDWRGKVRELPANHTLFTDKRIKRVGP